MCYLTVLECVLGYSSFQQALTTNNAGTSRPPSVSKLHSRFNTSIKIRDEIHFSNLFDPTLQSYECDDVMLTKLFDLVVALCSVANIQSEKTFTPTISDTVKYENTTEAL